MSTWLITGASRGLGAAVARHALSRGDSVVGTARDAAAVTVALGDTPHVLPVELDVTDLAAAHAAVDAAVAAFGRIDVVVNNAGRGLLGTLEEMSDAQIRAQFELNVFGVVNVIRAVLPVLRAQRSGTIVNVSSAVGISGFAASSMYGASKFAVEGLTEGLRVDLSPLGIRVFAIEPGMFRTDFLAPSAVWFAERAGTISDYDGTPAHQQLSGISDMDGAQDGDPDKLAALLYDVVASDHPPVRLPIGPDAVGLFDQRVARDSAELTPWRARAEVTSF
ncbi:SDR family NAD(P)-dependent oxidoreductase [Mycolicibacterium hippocampi]|uniref:Short-chain dehydrogenase/reductase n=1 Tax=Mycolicibacterium hippocampi TaxID=659824 RepID=A0A7I9ZL34_9MYCO|nr:SDR family NAD(P)-dependent oxidoreductase [Mycolicibacterium hippocampi]GFH01519.1 short-chain dehydrogenase/reductase [Mycolicibacterium hippocampi]